MHLLLYSLAWRKKTEKGKLYKNWLIERWRGFNSSFHSCSKSLQQHAAACRNSIFIWNALFMTGEYENLSVPKSAPFLAIQCSRFDCIYEYYYKLLSHMLRPRLRLILLGVDSHSISIKMRLLNNNKHTLTNSVWLVIDRLLVAVDASSLIISFIFYDKLCLIYVFCIQY